MNSGDIIHILDGDDSPSLSASIEQYIAPNGVVITAATDIGLYPLSKRNADRVGINVNHASATVVDGMGIMRGVDVFARCLAECLAAEPMDVQSALHATERDAAEKGAVEAAACFATARIEIENNVARLTAHRIGDVRVSVLDATHALIDESEDEDMASAFVRTGKITVDECRYHPYKNTVMRSVGTGGTYEAGPMLWENREIPRGGRVLLMSDGITDNLETSEIIDYTRGKAAIDVIKILDDLTTSRMRDWESLIERTPKQERAKLGKYSDGFLTKPKPDNRAIAILEVPT